MKRSVILLLVCVIAGVGVVRAAPAPVSYTASCWRAGGVPIDATALHDGDMFTAVSDGVPGAVGFSCRLTFADVVRVDRVVVVLENVWNLQDDYLIEPYDAWGIRQVARVRSVAFWLNEKRVYESWTLGDAASLVLSFPDVAVYEVVIEMGYSPAMVPRELTWLRLADELRRVFAVDVVRMPIAAAVALVIGYAAVRMFWRLGRDLVGMSRAVGSNGKSGSVVERESYDLD